jgi:recombinational DNA repair protein (RecF pathway)
MTVASGLASLTAAVGLFVLIVQGGRWTQKIEDRLDRISEREAIETTARIAGDLAESTARQKIADLLQQVQAEHAEIRQFYLTQRRYLK